MGNIYTCFPGGKHKVLTMSYDDGKEFDRRLVSIFNEYGIRGTFNINSGIIERDEHRVQFDEIKELYKGHEVATHTVTHPTIARCPKEQIVQQIMDDRKALESVVGYPVRGLAYPNGSYNKEIKEMLPHLGIEYARVVGSSKTFAIPDDFMQWQATCHHKTDLMKLAEEFAALFKKQYLYMMYVWGHSYEFDVDNNWELMEEFCKFIGGRDDIWYATNIEIVDYLNAAHNLKFSSDCSFVYNPSAASIWLEVDGQIVEVKGGEQKKLR